MSISLQIGTRNYSFFNKVNINLRYPYSASTFAITSVFDNESAIGREVFRPLGYQDVIITADDGTRLITGTILRNRYIREAQSRLSILMGYTRTGVLSDCQLAVTRYPRQFNRLSFREIANTLINPFGLQLDVENDDGVVDEVIEEITIDLDIDIFSFLNEIISQRNLVLTHNENGNLLVTKPNTSQTPIAVFSENAPSTIISLDVNGQGIHSEIGVLNQADVFSDNARESLIENPLITAFRPRVVRQNVGSDLTIGEAARNVLSNELRNIRLLIETDRWQWVNNGTPEIMRPNNIISVISPQNYIFNKTNFFVEEVRLILDPDKQVAQLSCVLPEVYNDETPINPFSL